MERRGVTRRKELKKRKSLKKRADTEGKKGTNHWGPRYELVPQGVCKIIEVGKNADWGGEKGTGILGEGTILNNETFEEGVGEWCKKKKKNLG